MRGAGLALDFDVNVSGRSVTRCTDRKIRRPFPSHLAKGWRKVKISVRSSYRGKTGPVCGLSMESTAPNSDKHLQQRYAALSSPFFG